jgi:hypothetical protein
MLRCTLRFRCGSILLKKDFQGDPRVILIQDEHPTSKIDSKIPPLGFDYFKFLFHSLILDTFSTVSVKTGNPQIEHNFSARPRILLQKSKVAGPRIFGENPKRKTITDSYNLNRIAEVACEFNVRR